MASCVLFWRGHDKAMAAEALAEEHLQQLFMDSEVKDNSHVEEMPEDFRCGVVGECIRSIEQENDLGVQDIMTNVLEEELPGIVEGYCAQNIGGQKSGFLHECVIVTSADGVEGAAEIINPPNLEEKLSWSALTKSSAESKERQGLDVLQPVETEESELEVTAVIKALECREGEHRRSSPASTSLRVLQWNVLADGLAQFGNFHRVEKEVLEWNVRAPLLLAKIMENEPDIICLQELNHFDDWLLPELQQYGYNGVFCKKPLSAAKKYKFPADGCAIFYQASRLQLQGKDEIQYVDAKGARQNQGALVCRFTDLKVNEEFIVATTHLKAKEGALNEQMRILQVQQLLQRIVIGEKDLLIPTITCGDFNAEPFSEVYKLFQQQFQSVYGLTCKCTPHQVAESEVLNICHSGCDGGAKAEPAYTTWKFKPGEEKRRTIDYIWYKPQSKLVPRRRWPIPSQSTIGENALPNAEFPSDHLPLTCEFVWRSSKAHPQ